MNLLLFFIAFRLLTSDEVATRDLIPGVIVAAVLLAAPPARAAATTSTTSCATPSRPPACSRSCWGCSRGSTSARQVTLFAAEINVVRARRLWPRSFFSDPLLDADRRALTSSAEVEERVHEQNVEVSFDEPDSPLPGSAFWLYNAISRIRLQSTCARNHTRAILTTLS